MNNIKNTFFIQELEIYSGIKAHTIRIWEKRYGLLEPTRLNRNIRKYSLMDLQKLLNVSLLYNNGYKISKISKYSSEELHEEARSFSVDAVHKNYYVNKLIMCMYTFDSLAFEETYLELCKKNSFESIFTEVYVPLLNHLGLLWQTHAIKPVHEHFISNLITQKIILNTSMSVEPSKTESDQTYVLFLPEGEIHEIGLLYLNLVLKQRGMKTIYLGSSLPIDNIAYVINKFTKATLVCAFMIDKTIEEKNSFMNSLEKLVSNANNQAFVVGSIWNDYPLSPNLSDKISFASDFKKLDFIN